MNEPTRMSRYLIGIDLGTTNSALAYVDSRARGEPQVHAFAVQQLVGPGELGERPLLPSVLYLPGSHDLPPGACALPWDADRSYVVGEFARAQGARVPGHLVSSAKSWLCHAGVDRTAAILPWAAPPDVPRLSPIEASTRILRHFAEAWDERMARQKEESAFARQRIVLTVPASFDDVARNLTVEAARKAGIERFTLLEEPQAAFYCWLAMHRKEADSKGVKPPTPLPRSALALVVDVGGGTSDFSLIQAVEQTGDLGFVRQAVGDHLLLGGDNMDLALARHVETKLPKGGKLDAPGFSALVQACRQAKEALLAPDAPSDFPVTVMGRGRAVVGGTLTTSLTRDEVGRILIDGFFPHVPSDAKPDRAGRVGLHEMGLPYVADAAITRHLAQFLREHGVTPERPPQAILFNGGVFQPKLLRDRLVDVLRTWYDRPGGPWHPTVLANPSLDLAVAWGAAYYGWLRHTGGQRITGGLARSYYVGVAAADVRDKEAGRQGDKEVGRGSGESIATPANEHPAQERSFAPVSLSPCLPVSLSPCLSVLCIVPQHLEEGKEIRLDQPELELALGQPVTFPLYTSTVRGDDVAGQLLNVAPEQLLRLPTLHTILRGGKRSGTKSVPVALAARLTEIGTLELSCVARNSDNRWRLEFNTRDIVQPLELNRGAEQPEGEVGDRSEATTELRSQRAEDVLTDVWPEEKIQAAGQRVRDVFAGNDSHAARELTRQLESTLEAFRKDWPTGLCRRLWEFLIEAADARGRTPAHLARWHNLVGFCLRPGFGDPLDKFRMDQLWKLLSGVGTRPGSGGGAIAAVGGADAWIMWRRVAGGLNQTLQQSLFERLRPILLPPKKGPPYKPNANELAEMWRAAASFERLDPKPKELLGQALLKLLRRSPVPLYAFWALTRLGTRQLLYGPLNTIIHPQVAETWLDVILPFEPSNESERQNWLFCLAQLAKRTQQRALDIGEAMRQRVLERMTDTRASERLRGLVAEGGELEVSEQNQLFGEGLPLGLRLVRSV